MEKSNWSFNLREPHVYDHHNFPPLPIIGRPRERERMLLPEIHVSKLSHTKSNQEYVGKDVLRNVFEAIPYYSRECVGRDEIT